MSYSVVYWNRAPQDVYEVIRSEMPAEWRLITLEGLHTGFLQTINLTAHSGTIEEELRNTIQRLVMQE
ncbi:MAG: hypothetical protein ABIN58_10870 [candidate division WOR-3 bacterium]